MPSNGIMEEIRSLLAQDKSSAEVIALGFKPSTVYKVRGQLRRENPTAKTEHPWAKAGTIVAVQMCEAEASEVRTLREQVSALERSVNEWELRYHELKDRFGHTTSAMGKEVDSWQVKFAAEEKARNEAEALTAQHGAKAARLQEVNQELRQKLESLPDHVAEEVWKLVQPLKAELEELRYFHSKIKPLLGSLSGRSPV